MANVTMRSCIFQFIGPSEAELQEENSDLSNLSFSVLSKAVEVPQQPTQEEQQPLTVGGEPAAPATLSPETPAVSPVGPNVGSDALQAPEVHHAPSVKGHCQQDTLRNESADEALEISAMDTLNKLEKKVIDLEESLVPPPFGRQPPDGHEFPANYTDPFIPLNNHVISENEDISSTRHSSGCDDSGVFLEDTPYVTETCNTTLIESKHKSPLVTISGSERLVEEKIPLNSVTISTLSSSNMRQYSIETQGGVDSDAEKSDDMGLASSSVDSADDLDGDPSPAAFASPPKSESPIYSPLKPPPVPCRMSLSNGHSESMKDQTYAQKQEATHAPDAMKAIRNIERIISSENINSSVSERRSSFQNESCKWKSEECLRSALENKWSLSSRHNEKSISVKDRIAMFSGMESDSSQLNSSKKEETLRRFSGESGVKHAQSTETLDRKCEVSDVRQNNTVSNGFSSLNRETKWYSMYNITPTTVLQASSEPSSENLKSSSSIPSLVSSGLQEVRPVTKMQSSSNIVGNSSNVNPLKVDTEAHRHQEKPIISSYPQTQLTNNKRYNYGLYSLKPLRTSEDLSKKSNGGLLSIIDPCKQQLPKLKGLVIPDRPPLHSTTSKALPTIVSSESLFPAKNDVAQLGDAANEKDWKRSSFPMTATSKTMSLPRNVSSKKEHREAAADKEAHSQKHSSLAEPPWKSGSCSTLPKYSPAFKRRTLELPHGLGSSLSPTPPSSITSPMSPPPSSPSSVCSSNASSSSIAAKQQNIFQFSLSHSKPVTPVLPEKPIMSPPSLPSDVEYEGDNSEDSTTSNSVSPMLSTQISMKNLDLSVSRETGPALSSKMPQESLSFLKTSTFSSSVQNVPFQAFASETVTSAASYQPYSNGVHHSDNLQGMKSEVTSTKLKQQFCVNKSSSFENTESQNGTMRNSSEGNSNNRNDMVTLRNAVNIMNSSQEVNDSAGNRNCFSDIRPEVVGKFHAQPVSVSEAASKSALAVAEKDSDEYGHKKSPDKNGFLNASEVARNCYSSSSPYVENGDGKGDIMSRTPQANGFGQDKLSWAHSDLISYKNTPVESDDDSHSSLSQRTEDSRHTTDECLSDATTDSLDKNVDPELRPRRLSQQRTVLRAAADSTDSVQKFRALAEKWEQRSEHRDVKSPTPTVNTVVPTKRESRHTVVPTAASATNSSANTNNSGSSSQSAAVKLPPSLMPRHQPPEAPPPERRISVPSLTMYNSPSSLTNGQRRESRSMAPRPASLIEDKEKDVFDSVWNDGTPSYVRRTSVKDNSNIDFLNSKKLSKSQVLHTGSRDSLDSIGIRSRPSSYFSTNKSKSISVSDIRKAFETQCQQTNTSALKLPPRRIISEDNVTARQLRMTPSAPSGLPPPDHRRISSIDSTASESDVGTPVRYGSVGSLTSISRDPYGSVTSLASSTSLISPQELQQLIDEANQSLEEAGNSIAHELLVVVLHREIPGGSIGITLAGGADYEVKEITVHKVISGSLADRDGRIRKGDRVISINGRNLKGITHRDALEILKAPRPEVVLVISRELTNKGIIQEKRRSLQEQDYREQHKNRENVRRKFEDAGIVHSEVTPGSQEQMIRVELLRDSTGLGFSIEGGKDSPLGDRPLTIKRIFKNGVADKEGQLDVNDEIVSVNGQPVTSMTRTEAWNFMKKLPEGPVILLARKAGQGSS